MPRDNGHHYTTAYTYKYVLPTIGELLDFDFSINDFDLVSVDNGIYDLSYIERIDYSLFLIKVYLLNEK